MCGYLAVQLSSGFVIEIPFICKISNGWKRVDLYFMNTYFLCVQFVFVRIVYILL